MNNNFLDFEDFYPPKNEWIDITELNIYFRKGVKYIYLYNPSKNKISEVFEINTFNLNYLISNGWHKFEPANLI